MQKKKIAQITLISMGFLLLIFTYILYPEIKKKNNLEAGKVKKRIETQEEIKELEKKDKILANEIKKQKNYFTSSVLAKKKQKLKNLKYFNKILLIKYKKKKKVSILRDP